MLSPGVVTGKYFISVVYICHEWWLSHKHGPGALPFFVDGIILRYSLSLFPQMPSLDCLCMLKSLYEFFLNDIAIEFGLLLELCCYLEGLIL
jgi:hypothetical protein